MSEAAETVLPLENKWEISEQYQLDERQEKTQEYANSFEKLCVFDTVESFWKFWNKLPSIGDVFYDGNEKLVCRNDRRQSDEPPKKYRILGQCIFKEGIEPKYEDPQNMKGGNMRVVFGSCFACPNSLVDEDKKISNFWETLVLSVIGETLDDGDNITGIRVIDKSNPYKKQVSHRVEIWFRDWKNEAFKTVLQERVEKLMESCDIHPKDLSFSENDFSKWTK